jgi:hypothetical protein
MQNTKEDIALILKDLKATGLPTTKIEKHLELSNGLLGKASKGTTNISEDKFQKLLLYYNNMVPGGSNKGTQEASGLLPEVDDITGYKKSEWVEKIESYCNKNNIIPEELIEAHKGKVKTKLKDILSSDKHEKSPGESYLEKRRKMKSGQKADK